MSSATDALQAGRPFSLEDFGRPCQLVTPLSDAGTLFTNSAIRVEDLEFHERSASSDAQLFVFKNLGVIEDEQQHAELEQLTPLSTTSNVLNLTAAVEDPWTISSTTCSAPKAQRLYTWEGFEAKLVRFAQHTPHLSESGSLAFDKACDTAGNASPPGATPQTAALRALCNLAIGRESVFFQWNEDLQRFRPVLPDVPISGLSQRSSRSVVDSFVKLGSGTRRLVDYARMETASRSYASLIALKANLLRVTDCLEGYILSNSQRRNSILHLHDLMQRPTRIVEQLCALVEAVKHCTTNGAVLSVLSEHAQISVHCGSSTAKLFNAILHSTSKPWLETLCEDLGLGLDGTSFPTLHVPSATRRNDGFEGMHGSPAFDVEMPAFVSAEDRSLISATQASMRIFREHVDGISSMSAKLSSNTSLDSDHSHDAGGSVVLPGAHENELWTDSDLQQDLLATMDARIQQPLGTGAEHIDGDELGAACLGALNSAQSPTGIGPDESYISPLDHLRPAIALHQRSIDRLLSQHVFNTLSLTTHIDLQHQYHLLGNGDFVYRLSTALFSDQTQSAERKRGIVPTAEAMGLRLDSRSDQRWPPASSELRLTLNGVLRETYNRAGPGSPRSDNEMPGGLSFSIRELPGAAIERVMDAGSIYALDFLRLQYTPPPCLDIVFTASALQAYDDIFRHLLRLLRVQHVATMTKKSLICCQKDHALKQHGLAPSSQACLTIANAAFSIASILLSHAMDVAVGAPWRRFQKSLRHARDELEGWVNNDAYETNGHGTSLEALRRLHDLSLELIRNRLFLRRKQEKIRTAIEELLAAVLDTSSAIGNAGIGSTDLDGSALRSNVHNVVNALEASIEKPNRGAASFARDDDDDADAIRVLIMRLREHNRNV